MFLDRVKNLWCPPGGCNIILSLYTVIVFFFVWPFTWLHVNIARACVCERDSSRRVCVWARRSIRFLRSCMWMCVGVGKRERVAGEVSVISYNFTNNTLSWPSNVITEPYKGCPPRNGKVPLPISSKASAGLKQLYHVFLTPWLPYKSRGSREDVWQAVRVPTLHEQF